VIEVRQGDILHVPYPEECLQYLAVGRDLLVYLQNGPYFEEVAWSHASVESMTQHWHGVHPASECRQGPHDNTTLVWRDS